jgi:type IV pilus assembly protein PilQ
MEMNNKPTMSLLRIMVSMVLLMPAMLPGGAVAQNRAYCNITAVESQQLSNGVQITVKADGVVDWEPEGGNWSAFYGGESNRLVMRFPNAKSQIGRTFVDVSKYPVSYVQLSVPQDAPEGVGLTMLIGLYEPSSVNVNKSTDRQSIVITVNSKRTITARATANGSNGSNGGGTRDDVEVRDGKVTIHALKARLLPLLGKIAELTGANLAADDSVKDREVSMTLEGLSLDEALTAITSAYGLAFSNNNGVYMICDGTPNDLATYRLSGTESFRMKYIKAQTASGLLPTFLYSFLHVNEEQNAVVVTAPTQMLDKIRSDFTKVDLAPPQIMIEALAVEVASTDDLNAALTAAYEHDHITSSLDTATGDISYRTVGQLPHDFYAQLKALVAQGKARVRSNPRMAAVNGQQADLFIGQTKFIKVSINTSAGKQEYIQGVDVGVKLQVRPWTGGNGEITVGIQPEVSNISEQERETGLPVISTRRAETTVRVKDGETVMIGGLTQRQDYKTRTKVPILGDIPILGALFQSTKTNSISSELVVFVTPHILTDRGRLKDEAKEQELRERLK